MTDPSVPGRQQSSMDLRGLIADGAAADHVDKLMLFGQFVGDWEADFSVYGPEGIKQTEKAEWHFAWVLDGRAVQDVFILPKRSERPQEQAVRSEYGTAVRFYDPGVDAWHVVWISPVNGDLHILVARKVGDEIILTGNDSDGSPMQWIFSNITDQSFHWRRVFSLDKGKTWRLHKEMWVRRAGPVA